MTDNEIISLDMAIKHCYEVSDRKCDDCGKEHLQLAKWLEELQKNREVIQHQKAEIERYLYSIKLLEKDLQTAKFEAIKEFAERVDYLIGTTPSVPNRLYRKLSAGIKNLVKETTGSEQL